MSGRDDSDDRADTDGSDGSDGPVRGDDDKTLLTEILPAPEAPAHGNPRQRTTDHLRRILAAAGLALQLPGVVSADSSLPPPHPTDGKGKPEAGTKGLIKKKPKPKPETDPGYYVVDMLPEPADVPPPPPPPPETPARKPGSLSISSTVPAAISVDGKATGLRTPQTRMSLPPGTHAITLRSDKGRPLESFTVEITSDKESVEARDPRPRAKGKKP